MPDYDFPFQHDALNLVFQEWVERDARSAKLSPAYRVYYRLRKLIPGRARRLLQRNRPVVAPRDWFMPVEFLRQLAAAISTVANCPAVVHPWPDGAEFALVLTHDVDTAAGVGNVARIAQIEEDLGLRSSWNFVPHKYAIDEGLLRDLRDRGFEIGVHGYNHDGKLFLSQRIFRRRVKWINQAVDQFEAAGFRAPMVHRNLDWLNRLAIDYDASCFDVDPYQAMPGGVGSVWPFVAGRFVEIPYTLPQDHTLLVARGERLLPVWLEKFQLLNSCSGAVVALTHPDYLTAARDQDDYAQFLSHVGSQPGCWNALPRDLAIWWRQRQASKVIRDDAGQPAISGLAAATGRVAYMAECDGLPRFISTSER